MDSAVVARIRAAYAELLADVRAARPETGSDEETAYLVRLATLGYRSFAELGPELANLMRSGLSGMLDDAVRLELATAETERKLALRHLQAATNTLTVLVERLNTPVAALDVEESGLVAQLLDEMNRTAVRLTDSQRATARFQMDVLVALDVMDGSLEDLTYWALRALTGARKVEAYPQSELFAGVGAELARAHARRAWSDWEAEDVAEELAPWPSP